MVMEKSISRDVSPGMECSEKKVNTWDFLPNVHPSMVHSPYSYKYENWCILNANTEAELSLSSVLLQKSAGLPQVLHVSKQT